MKNKTIKRISNVLAGFSLVSVFLSSCGNLSIPKERKDLLLNGMPNLKSESNPIDLFLPKIFTDKDDIFISDWKKRQEPSKEWLEEFKNNLKFFHANREIILSKMREKWYYFLSNLKTLTWGYTKVDTEIFDKASRCKGVKLSDDFYERKKEFVDSESDLKNDLNFANEKYIEDARIPLEVTDSFLTYYFLLDDQHFMLLSYDFSPSNGTGADGRPDINWNVYRFANKDRKPNFKEFEWIKHAILAHSGDCTYEKEGFSKFDRLSRLDGVLLKYELKSIDLGNGISGTDETIKEDKSQPKDHNDLDMIDLSNPDGTESLNKNNEDSDSSRETLERELSSIS
ncbi:hypothetical protein [Mycoplasma bradburyae]|uniref:Lipoprotein n=1 Tax=Mycoplasma bradburyae TaxID=2963128 RepID=A0AAW6HQZ4_9MOLU|nr:hypothetical protein [Mycoplasma bradburyae]MDC4183116.1 hypothetical protein [Mycoplasma bradburyae]UTS70649.1 hypothetical protein NMG77_02755 [Mycoplasma bradburyae]